MAYRVGGVANFLFALADRVGGVPFQDKQEAGLNRFVMSAKQWIEKTHAKGIIAKAGRYGGTYAYKDIALELLQNNGVIRILIRKEILEIMQISMN